MLGLSVVVQGDKITPAQIEILVEDTIGLTLGEVKNMSQSTFHEKLRGVIDKIDEYTPEITTNSLRIFGFYKE